jgi:putative SOS response-associated peptidase YedK
LWKPLFQKKRCIIPAAGFYEHHTLDKDVELPGGKKPTNKVPYYFKLKSSDIFGFAGLYSQWEDHKSGQTVGTFSIITTNPNPLVAKIHNKKNRMPTILREEDYDFWLDESVNPDDYFGQNIFVPYPEDDMEAWQVSKMLDYGKETNDLTKPVNNPIDLDNPESQQNLFGS